MENEEKKNITNTPNNGNAPRKKHGNNFSHNKQGNKPNNQNNRPNNKPNNQNNKPNNKPNNQNNGNNQEKSKKGAPVEQLRSTNNIQHQNRKNGNVQNQNAQNHSIENDKKLDNHSRKNNEKKLDNRDNHVGNKNERKQNNGSSRSNQKVESRKDTYVYILDGNIYINLTNRCSNGCDFCVRNERTSYYGNYLWLTREPTSNDVIAAINGLGDINKYQEVVFCGFGEPTYKMSEMLAVCDYVHSKGMKTRLNTNGQGNLINKRDIVPELKGKIDLVNISLNAETDEKYKKICRSMFREQAYPAIIEFAKLCKRNGVAARFSVVDCIGEEAVDACKGVASSVGVPLYVRKYITDS